MKNDPAALLGAIVEADEWARAQETESCIHPAPGGDAIVVPFGALGQFSFRTAPFK